MARRGGFQPHELETVHDEDDGKETQTREPSRTVKSVDLSGVSADEFFRGDIKKEYHDVRKSDSDDPLDDLAKSMRKENRRAEAERRARFPPGQSAGMDPDDFLMPGESEPTPTEELRDEIRQLREVQERFERQPAGTVSKDDTDDLDALRSLLDALRRPDAETLLRDLDVEFVSSVETPAQDSEWVLAKDADGGASWRTEAPLLKAESGEGERKAYAPVLVPGEADEHGDVVPVGEIATAAHGYLSEYRQLDEDHEGFDDGSTGVPVESWTLKSPQSFERADGSTTREYPAGTWMMGVEFTPEAWERVESGELSGFSIQGSARSTDASAALDELEAEAQAVAKNAPSGKPSIDEGVCDRVLDSIESSISQLESYAESNGVELDDRD
jgi:hypothetical protein